MAGSRFRNELRNEGECRNRGRYCYRAGERRIDQLHTQDYGGGFSLTARMGLSSRTVLPGA